MHPSIAKEKILQQMRKKQSRNRSIDYTRKGKTNSNPNLLTRWLSTSLSPRCHGEEGLEIRRVEVAVPRRIPTHSDERGGVLLLPWRRRASEGGRDAALPSLGRLPAAADELLLLRLLPPLHASFQSWARREGEKMGWEGHGTDGGWWRFETSPLGFAWSCLMAGTAAKSGKSW